jgi:hypothetical protein
MRDALGIPWAFRTSWNAFTLDTGFERSWDPWRIKTGGNFARDSTGRRPATETMALIRGSRAARTKAMDAPIE